MTSGAPLKLVLLECVFSSVVHNCLRLAIVGVTRQIVSLAHAG